MSVAIMSAVRGDRSSAVFVCMFVPDDGGIERAVHHSIFMISIISVRNDLMKFLQLFDVEDAVADCLTPTERMDSTRLLPSTMCRSV